MLRKNITIVATSTSLLKRSSDSVAKEGREWAKLWLGLFRINSSDECESEPKFVKSARKIAAVENPPSFALEQLWADYRLATHWSLASLKTKPVRFAVTTLLTRSATTCPDRVAALLKDLDTVQLTLSRAEANAVVDAWGYANLPLDERIDAALLRRDEELALALLKKLAVAKNRVAVESLRWRGCWRYRRRKLNEDESESKMDCDSALEQVPIRVIPHHILCAMFDALTAVQSLQFALALYDTQKRALEHAKLHTPYRIESLKADEFERVRDPESPNLETHDRIRYSYDTLPFQIYKDLLFMLGSTFVVSVYFNYPVSASTTSQSHSPPPFLAGRNRVRQPIELSFAPSNQLQKWPYTIVNPFIQTTPELQPSSMQLFSMDSFVRDNSVVKNSIHPPSTSSTASPSQSKKIRSIPSLSLALPIFKESLPVASSFSTNTNNNYNDDEEHGASEAKSPLNQIYNRMLHVCARDPRSAQVHTQRMMEHMRSKGMTVGARAAAAVVSARVHRMVTSDDAQLRAVWTEICEALCDNGNAKSPNQKISRRIIKEAYLRALCGIKRYALAWEIAAKEKGDEAVGLKCLEFCLVKAGEDGRPRIMLEFLNLWKERGGTMNASIRDFLERNGGVEYGNSSKI